MTPWLHTAAALTTVLGLVSACVAHVAVGRFRTSLGVLLDFLTAAGLIKLADEPSWGRVAAAAGVIAVRKLITTRLGRPLLDGTRRADHRPA